ncbi:hypothetical protein IID19_03545 [Patescibacteria group bacterium]|nr:hypothetical protein [Patescibacteria group bacterium]
MADESLNKITNVEDHGDVLASWDFPEFVKYQRTLGWYIITSVVVLAFILFGIFTQNYLFIVLIAIFIIIYVMRSRREPIKLNVSLTEDGIEIGTETFYKWKDIKSFWIIYEPPEVKNLYFDFKTGIRPSISISLESQNPVNIRKKLLEFLTEDTEKENESFSDGLSRMLKL